MASDVVKALMVVFYYCMIQEDCKSCPIREFCAKAPSSWA